MDNIHGEKARSILYNIAETVKANGLNPYEYFRYLLEESCHRKARYEQIEDYIKELIP